MSKQLTVQEKLEQVLIELSSKSHLAENVFVDRYTTEEGKKVIVLEVELDD